MKSDYYLHHFCLCVYPSVRQPVRPSIRSTDLPKGTTLFLQDRFSQNLVFDYFSKMYREKISCIKI